MARPDQADLPTSDAPSSVFVKKTPPEPIIFDEDGDLELLLWHRESNAMSEDPTEDFRFIVSSACMARCCKAWDCMLNGNFKEAQQTSGRRVIPLPGDHPYAVEIVLNIAHLHFADLPTYLGDDMFYQLAVLANKYDLAGLLEPWLDTWFEDYEAPDWLEDGADEEPRGGYSYHVAFATCWIFRRPTVYEGFFRAAVRHALLDRRSAELDPDPEIEEAYQFVPSELRNHIYYERTYLIRRLLKASSDSIARATRDQLVRCKYKGADDEDEIIHCEALNAGLFLKHMARQGLQQSRISSADITETPANLAIRIADIPGIEILEDTARIYDDDSSALAHHAPCFIQIPFSKTINKIMRDSIWVPKMDDFPLPGRKIMTKRKMNADVPQDVDSIKRSRLSF
ncbi:hypothetical protein K490DRAFT_65836 [Saccharata proteae CBS 121410]|uniref:BTB domain-containing protein n=1 Tax=Saccharata proteae CBS 121410 TaxID=1314787 RepID=A0A9P4LXB9_9PEZI|nr:hypothetical protein K490DRAFT_65836 [Saccharata proteae CBS 121410]